jgi:hypothetical protein
MQKPRSDVGEGDISRSVVEAVADAEGVRPEKLRPPLYEVLDPDALERVFHTSSGRRMDGSVVFEYNGHEVTVFSDGTVTLDADE